MVLLTLQILTPLCSLLVQKRLMTLRFMHNAIKIKGINVQACITQTERDITILMWDKIMSSFVVGIGVIPCRRTSETWGASRVVLVPPLALLAIHVIRDFICDVTPQPFGTLHKAINFRFHVT